MSTVSPAAPDLSHLWMPFTANRQFKAHPRLLASAKGMYYTDTGGRQILDGTAGLGASCGPWPGIHRRRAASPG